MQKINREVEDILHALDDHIRCVSCDQYQIREHINHYISKQHCICNKCYLIEIMDKSNVKFVKKKVALTIISMWVSTWVGILIKYWFEL
jgi:hypothetical protein